MMQGITKAMINKAVFADLPLESVMMEQVPSFSSSPNFPVTVTHKLNSERVKG